MALSSSLSIDRIEGAVMPVNSYLVTGPDGVVVVDAQLTVADAATVRAAIDATGLPLAGVLITHPHPDHYAGLATVAGDDPTVPIVSTADVARVIGRDDALKDEIVGPMMGEQWPAVRPFPNRIVEPGEAIELAGLRFTVREVGAGESDADTIWELDRRTLFTGDVAYNGMHAYLADGNVASWIEQLDRLHELLPDDATLYVGHGEPAPKGVLIAQRHYIEAFVEAVHDAVDDVPDSRASAVTAAMRQILPDERLLFLMQLSIEPVAAMLRGDDTPPAATMER